MTMYTLESRTIKRDGQPLVTIGRAAKDTGGFAFNPHETDDTARAIVAALNAGETPDKRATNELGAKFWKQAAPMYLACLLAKMRPAEPPLMAATDAAALHAYGRTYTKVRVAECNRELTARDRTRALNARKAARAIAAVYGLDVDVSGDGLGLCLCGPVLAAATRSDASISLGD